LERKQYKIKTMRYLTLLVLLFAAQFIQAQENPFSQENAELNALKKYELTHPPRPTNPMPAPAADEALFGARLIRSATLLATSCPERRWPVKILIYGQSISGSQIFTEQMSAYLKEKFPYADISLENRSIGGFGGDRLIRTAVHDVYTACADLIIFHVYGGEQHGELEQFFTNVRRYTTADILLMNHHLSGNQTEYIPSSYQYLRYIANKYNCELADISTEWMKYLSDNHLKTADLLRDGTHPNRNGNWLLAYLVGRHLQYNPLFPGEWQNRIQTCFATSAYDHNPDNPLAFKGQPWNITDGVPTGVTKQGTLKLTFYGNRVDVIAGQLQNGKNGGTAHVIIDGKADSDKNLPYAITRPGHGPGTWFPAIKRVSHQSPLLPEKWLLKIDKINPDSTVWFFTVKGSLTGIDGSGRSDQPFVSKSGRVVIDVADYMFTDIKKGFKVMTPVGFEVNWSVVPLFQSTYNAPVIADKAKMYKTTLVQGLKNGPHTLELIPNGDGSVPVEAFEIHRPPIQ